MGILSYGFLLVLTLFVVGIIAQALWDITGHGHDWGDDE